MPDISVFKDLATAESLQYLIDTRNDKFNTPWYTQYFEWDTPQVTLTYSAVLGASVINAAASIVARDSATPLRSRETLGLLSGEIPAIKELVPLNENQYRHYMALLNLPNVKDQAKKAQALKLIWDDVKKVVDAVNNRLDILTLQAVSTGKISINTNNNPDGLVTDDIDLLMPTENKKTAATAWNETSATPLTDIMKVLNETDINFGKILISKNRFNKLISSKEVRDTLGAFFGITSQALKGATAPLTLGRLNQYMSESDMPIFEVVNKKSVVEGVNGKPIVFNPFEDKNLAFIPEGKLGVIKNAIAVEEQRPVENISYALSGRILVSKWANNEPFREYTKSECNAFPVVEQINQIVLLTTEN